MDKVYLLLTQWNGRGERAPYALYATLEQAQAVALADPALLFGDNSWHQSRTGVEWSRITYHRRPVAEDDQDDTYNVHWTIREMTVQTEP